MKTTAVYRSDFKMRPNLPYPNAATRREVLSKFLDLLLVAAIGAGSAACLLLLLALG